MRVSLLPGPLRRKKRKAYTPKPRFISEYIYIYIYSRGFTVQFSCSVMSDSLRPHELQHARPPCPSPTPRTHPNQCPLSQQCHPASHMWPPIPVQNFRVYSNFLTSHTCIFLLQQWGIRFYFLFLRYNSHTLKFTSLKFTIHWYSGYSQSCITIIRIYI